MNELMLEVGAGGKKKQTKKSLLLKFHQVDASF